MRLAIGGVLVARVPLAGCSDSGGPGDLPPLGRYRLEFAAQRPGDLSAVMVLTHADSLAGRWESDNVDPELSLGFWNLDAWVVGAAYTDFAGFFTFRLVADEDTELRCVSGRFNDGDVSQAVTCQIDYLGP